MYMDTLKLYSTYIASYICTNKTVASKLDSQSLAIYENSLLIMILCIYLAD